jgi:CAAX protease family protein
MQESTINTQTFSIFGTFLWMLFLAIGIQALLGFAVAFGMGVAGFPVDDIELLFNRPDLMAATGLIAAFLSYPLVKKAAYQSGAPFPFEFLALKAINKETLVKVLLIGFGYYAFATLTSYLLAIEVPEFMLELKSHTNTGFDLLMLVIAICIVAPIVEEVIFRGLAYTRLVNSRAGVTGAIIITSLVFTAIHIQYDFMILAILSVFAFLVGYVRYKTDNLVYCIALHMQLNMMSTIELFFFV